MGPKIILSCLTGIGVLFTSFASNNESFTYQFKVRANSFSAMDEAALYYTKEKVIDIYEKLALSVDEANHTELIKNNIQLFSYADNVVASYQNGMIFIVIGKGKGTTISGKLRKNYCDESAIREKIYIFDLLK